MEHLFISESTVDAHVQRIYLKTGENKKIDLQKNIGLRRLAGARVWSMMHPAPISDESFDELLKIVESVMTLSVKFKLALRSVLYETIVELSIWPVEGYRYERYNSG